MSPKAPNCPDCTSKKSLCEAHFKALQKQWYDIAAATGFKDAENGEFLINNSSSASIRKTFNLTQAQARQEYYRLAGFFLYDYSFGDETELDIWKHHARGIPIREITKLIRAKYPNTYKKSMVHNIITRLAKIMKRLYNNG